MDRKGPGIRRSMSFSHGLYSQSYYHPPKISLLPPPEVTRIRCLVSQDRKPRPLQRKTSFLQKITGKSGGRKEEPLRKLPLPEIFYNNNDLEQLIDNLSDKEEENVENQETHDSASEDEAWPKDSS